MSGATTAAGSLPGLRRRNRLQVLELVRDRGSISRADIAKQSGLSTTTVSTLVGELLDEGVLVELDNRTAPAGGAGRPARLLAFDPAAGAAIGIHLAHDHVRIGLTDLAGRLVASELAELDVDHHPVDTLDHVAATALRLAREAKLGAASIVGLGVAVSAPVASRTHSLDPARILPDWRGIDISEQLRTRTGLHVEVGNDANLGAIAEHRLGAAQQVDHFVYVMLSDGVGAGLILGGELYDGAIGGAGELGHVTVVPGGFVCRCGSRGCLETVAGAHAITSAMSLIRGRDLSVADVVAAAGSGDEGARRVLADAGAAVGRALTPICTVLDPALVVIGGACSTSPALIDAAAAELARSMTPLRTSRIPVRPGSLGDDAEMLGAITLVARLMALP